MNDNQPSSPVRNKKEYVIFDGACGFCTAASDELHALDSQKKLEFVPYQDPTIQKMLKLPRVDRLDYMFFVDKNGHVHAGARAVFEAMKRLPGFWGAVGHVFSHSILLMLSEVAYRFIARARFSISRMLRLTPHLEREKKKKART